MGIREKLGLSSWKEFYTLEPWYKWIIYIFGWISVVLSWVWLIVEAVLYFTRDKSKEKEKGKIKYNYQKLPYWLGWIGCGLALLIVPLVIFGLIIAGSASAI